MRYQMIDAPMVVVRMTGEVMVVAQDGVVRPVQLGERIPAGSMLVLDSVAKLQLEPDTGNEQPIPAGGADAVPGMQEVVQQGAATPGISPLGEQATNDIAALQAAILEGQDPTLNFEATAAGGAPAAGGGAGGSGNGGFVTVDRTGGSTLASAGFDTSYAFGDQLVAPQPTTVLTDIALNQPPVADEDAVTLAEDSLITINVLANDSDPDGDAITLVGTPSALHGVVVVNPDGSITYTPQSNYNGPDTITYTISDSTGATSTSTVAVTVTPVNDPPVLVDVNNAPLGEDLTVTTAEDTPISGVLLATDLDGDSLTFTKVSDPVNGTVTVDAQGNWTYTPNPDYNGSDRFTATVSDGQGGTDIITVNIGVTPVNDPPVLVGENNQPLGDDVTVSTPEDTPVSGILQATDVDGDALSFAKATDPTNGTVTVDAQGNWTYTPNPDYNGSDSFTATVSDGQGGTDTITVNIGVTPVNDPPVLVDGNNQPLGDDVTVSTPEDTPVSGILQATDVDGDALSFAKATDPTNGTVIVDAQGNWTYTPNPDYNGSDSFTATVSDGQGGTDTITVNIGVTPVNDPPVLVDANNAPLGEDLAVTTKEDTSVSGQLLATDVDGDPLTFAKNSDPAHGSVTVNSDGSWTYTPASNYNGSDSFTAIVSDGQGGTDSILVNIGVTPENDSPVAVADSITVAEGGTATVLVGGASSVLVNDTDAEQDTLNAILVTGPTNGSLKLNADGTFNYQHNGSETTSDSFSYKVNDGTVDGNTVTVNITVEPANDAPVAVADSITVAEGGTATVLVGGASSVLVNDTDAEQDTLNAILVTGPTNGSLKLNADGTFNYQHNGSETTSDSFSYKVNDGTVDGNTVTVNITVEPANDAPVAVADSITVAEGGTATVLVGGASSVLVNDTDAEQDTLNAILVTGPTNGSLKLNADGTFNYQHNGSETTSDSFSYKVNDGTVDGNTVTVNITVEPANDAPVAVADSITVAEGGTATVLVGGASSVLVNDTDAEQDTLNAILVTGPTNGSLKLNADGTFNYQHNGSETTSDSFSYKVNDGTVDGNTVTVNITVEPANDAPVAVADSITVAEGGTATVLVGGASSVLVNDTDAEQDTLNAILVTGPTNGSLKLNADGTFNYQHNGSETTSDSFSYKVNDGTVDGNTVTVNITVEPANDAPVAVADSITVAEGGTATVLVGGASSVLVNDTDAEQDTLNAILVTGPTNGSLKLNADGTFNYQHNGSETTSDSFSYKVNDGTVDGNTVTVNITVEPANDAPVAVADSITVAEGGTATVLVGGASSVLVNDTDAEQDTLNAILVTGPTNGSLKLNADGTFNYQHNGSETTSDSFSYKVNDGTVDGNTVTVNITVEPANDAPVAVADSITVAEGGTATVLVGGASSVLVNDTDAEQDTLNAILVTGPTNGSLKLNADGTFNYQHNGSETTSDSFSYKVNDGTVDGNTVTVNITVEPANDAPVAVADSITVAEGGTATVLVGGASSVLVNDTDAEQDTLNAILVTGPTNGSLKLNADGTFNYQHNGSETTSDSFSYKVNDGTVDGNTVTVNITITPVDEPITIDLTKAIGREVYENDLPNGTDITKESLTKSGIITLTVPDGLASISIAGHLITAAELQAVDEQHPISWTGGLGNTLAITGFDSLTGELSYEYTLVKTQTHTGVQDTSLPENLEVIVTDIDGDSLSATFSVAIIDDTPIITAPASIAINNVAGITTGTWSYQSGADELPISSGLQEGIDIHMLNQLPGTVPVTNDKYDSTGNYLGSELTVYTDSSKSTTFFTLFMKTDGTYTFNLVTANPAVTDTLTFNKSIGGNPVSLWAEEIVNKLGGSGIGIDMLFTATSLDKKGSTVTSTVNSSTQGIGVGGNWIDSGDTLNIQYYKGDLDNNAGTHPTLMTTVDSAQFKFDLQGAPGESSLVEFVIHRADNSTDTVSLTVNAGEFVTISDAEGFNAVDIRYLSGAEVRLSGSSSSVYILPDDQPLNFEVSVTDGDGDISSQSFAFTLDTIGAGGMVSDGSLLTGSSGSDALIGNNSDDVLYGLGGNDFLIGHTGNDQLTGGDGFDRFVWKSEDADYSTDKITDFLVNQDKLDLADVLNNASGESLDNYLHFSKEGGNAVLQVFSNGTGNLTTTPELTIVMEGLGTTDQELIDLQQYLIHQDGLIK